MRQLTSRQLRPNMFSIGLALAWSASVLCAAERPPALRAGAAAIDVTPQQFPLNMPGGFSENFAHRAHDPLFARALVLDDGAMSIALVVLDNLGAAPEVLNEAKQRAAQATGIPVERMLICSTHTHSAPESNVREGAAPAVAYRRVLVDGLTKSIIQAHAALRPAAFGSALHPLPEEVFNRRWHLKLGKMPLNPFGQLDLVQMNPGLTAEVLERPAGPTDPDITILSVQDAEQKPVALLANYALHYVGGVGPREVSADYFGEFARLLPARMGAGEAFVAMMSNGASGDINNLPFLVDRPARAPYEQIHVVAEKAAIASAQAYRKIEQHRSDVRLGMVQREIDLKYRRPTAEQLAEARRVLALTDPEAIARLPRLAQHYARNTVKAAERQEDTLRVIVQAIRVGDLAICAIPFETFVEIGLELKKRSPFPQTMVIGLANGRHGYLPTPRHHQLGGYETWLGTNLVQESSSVMLTDNLLAMLTELNRAE